MKRIELFEFEDYDWLPKTIRTSCTHLIVVLHKMLGTPAVLIDLLRNVRQHYPFTQITDLGSGSGGAMPLVMEQWQHKTESVQLLLTDLHPHPEFVSYINKKGLDYLRYHPDAVDATQFDQVPGGLKTMVNSFHHMSPPMARKILASAQDNRQPLLIYEMGENFVPTWLWWLLLPLSLCILIVMALIMTLFVKPLGWKQVVFTYLIPIIPLVYAWDGQASTMRTYTFDDLKSILPPAEAGYTWTMEKAKKRNGKNLGYYVLGLPLSS
ncbi:hypothetical protein [Sediminicola luteus]|uniref:Class I SAM-dependent methyltransferase n=1 Tax=Sediminicola luteus TaxID=319238 RepID=A0A2A4GDD7_9FLAO|nr:hypothetical protein [Sediminicola luteus]PCE66607.1 hypothetical protein B7P33_04745 [Sediminicola luteus]